MTKQVIGLGAGGHAKIVIEILRLLGDFEVVGLLDANPKVHGASILHVPILGDDSLLPELFGRGLRHAFVGLGGTGDNQPRTTLYMTARENGFEVVSAIDPRAIIAPSAVLGDGVMVMPGAIINADSRVANNVIINTGAIVEHDCTIGNDVHIATGARLGGGVTVRDGAHVGLGAAIKQGVQIGRKAIVGAGAVVIHDVADNATVVGVPARPLERK